MSAPFTASMAIAEIEAQSSPGVHPWQSLPPLSLPPLDDEGSPRPVSLSSHLDDSPAYPATPPLPGDSLAEVLGHILATHLPIGGGEALSVSRVDRLYRDLVHLRDLLREAAM